MRLFLEMQWSPEQISNRLLHESSPFKISYFTIYRAIYAGLFDTSEQRNSKGNRGAIRKLRHRGKTRRRTGTIETRGRLLSVTAFSNVQKKRIIVRGWGIGKPIPWLGKQAPPVL